MYPAPLVPLSRGAERACRGPAILSSLKRPAIMSPFSVMKGDGTDGGVAVEAVGRGSAVGRKLTLQEAARVLRLSVRQVRRTGRSPVSDELGWRGSLAG